MDRNQYAKLICEYNKSLNKSSLTKLEKTFVKAFDKHETMAIYYMDDIEVHDQVEDFINQNRSFEGLLPKGNEKLCVYLRAIGQYTCNRHLVRMDARSRRLSYYKETVKNAIGAFYEFYGANLSLKDVIYGIRKNGFYSMTPVITAELLTENKEAIQLCKDVLTSENNTSIITRDLIRAIEQSKNKELWELLTKVFLGAQLQEGLRQAVVETADEGQLEFFINILKVIKDNNLLRFSSVQRGVMTWLAIGYDTPDEKDVRFMFDKIYQCITDKKEQEKALADENPLSVYISLYSIGIVEVDDAIKIAVDLLESQKPHIVASAIIYLLLTYHFDPLANDKIYEKYKDDPWIMALYFKSLSAIKMEKIKMDQKTVKEIYFRLADKASSMKDTEKYKTQGFGWFRIELYRSSLVRVMISLLEKHADEKMVEAILPFVGSYFNYGKGCHEFLDKYFKYVSEKTAKEFMIKEVISSNSKLVKWIEEKAKTMNLTEDDIVAFEGRLKSKKENARAAIVNIIAAQSKETVLNSYERLAKSNNSQINQCAHELKLSAPDYFDEEIEEFTFKGADCGYGFYEPRMAKMLSYNSFLPVVKRGFFKKKEFVDVAFFSPLTKEQIMKYFNLWDQRIAIHQDDEFELFGDVHRLGEYKNFLCTINLGADGLDSLPFADVWRKYFKEDRLKPEEIFQIGMYINTDLLMTKAFPPEARPFEITGTEVRQIPNYGVFETIFLKYLNEWKDSNGLREIAARHLEFFQKAVKYNSYKVVEGQNKYVESASSSNLYRYFVNCINIDNTTDEEFKEYFPLIYNGYIRYNLKSGDDIMYKTKINPLTGARACLLGIIPESELIEIILGNYENKPPMYYFSSDNQISAAYNLSYGYGRHKFEVDEEKLREVEFLRGILDKIADYFIHVEAKRLNEVTELTPLMHQFTVIRGMKYLIIAMNALRNEKLTRNTYGDDRVSEFSNIIKNCYPVEGDDAAMLAVEGFDEKRLVEVAMLAPQWIDSISQVLGWNGFKEACNYFIAHMKEYDMQHKKAQIAQYTNLEPEDLNDGAFDIDWCKKVYEKLGEKHMKIMYDSAKFLCTNSFHTRVRKYTDACMEKKSKEEFMKGVLKSRNKDDLNAYCICPVKDDKDLLERYNTVQTFLKESKKFGAQRQASEKRTCEIALMNLARNSKYENPVRLSWMMESEIIKQYEYALNKKEVDDKLLWIEIDENGQNEIVCEKNGKRLKSVPAKLNKDERVMDLKNIHKMWTEQYRRSRKMLEEAMEEKTVFTRDEIEKIMENPIIAPMLSKLVLVSHGKFGFFGQDMTLGEGIRIAHPYDLYEAGLWKSFQKEIFEKQIKQPFKQVFRELYLKLDDELEASCTKRYTGYQIQPTKAAGALKSRKWNVSYENGLEKVCYKDNIIVNLYADADWFSPSEIEAPSIDNVSFYSRKDYKSVKIKDIDNVTFSEIMRDVDLAVSTAFVGGVDPVTSFSTIELRASIIQYTCQLMKLDNVSIVGSFAKIEGKLNTYRVQLGSGSIHQDGGGNIYMVPVYSGKRGKVYLPFLDEDPMTAQILTKVIMLAEDHLIKDPSILEQMAIKS